MNQKQGGVKLSSDQQVYPDDQIIVDSLVSRCLAERPEDVVDFMTDAVQKLQVHDGMPVFRTLSDPIPMGEAKKLSIKEENEYLRRSIRQLDDNLKEYQAVLAGVPSVQLKGSPKAGTLRPNSAGRKKPASPEQPLPASLVQLQEQTQTALAKNLAKSPVLKTKSLSMDLSKDYAKPSEAAASSPAPTSALSEGSNLAEKAKEEHKQQTKAATVIQAQARGRIARNETRHLLKPSPDKVKEVEALLGLTHEECSEKELMDHQAKTQAAIKIQALHRGGTARQNLKDLAKPSSDKVKEVEALLGLAHEESKEELMDHQAKTQAATKIQALHRGGTARQTLKVEQDRRNKAATLIQAQARGRLTRNSTKKHIEEMKQVEDLYKQVEGTDMGLNYEECTEAEMLEHEKRIQAAVKIQALHRGGTARSDLKRLQVKTDVGELKVLPVVKQNSLEWTPLNMEEITPVHISLDLHTPCTPGPPVGVFFTEMDLTEENLIKAAESGCDPDVLSTIHGEEGCTEMCADKHLLDRAAKAGNLATVEWLHLHCERGGATKQAMDDAAGEGHLRLVEWLHANRTEGCTKKAMGNAALAEHFDVCDWLNTNRKEGCEFMFLDKAAAVNSMPCMRWMFDVKKQRCTKKAMDIAAEHGNLEMVEFLHEKYKIVGGTFKGMDAAAKKGHLPVVEWLHRNRKEGCTVQAMDGAATEGHLDIVEWLHENRSEGCTQDSINGAARNGFLDVVQWLHSVKNVQASSIAMAEAAANGHLNVMKFLHTQQGTEIPQLAHLNASKNFHEDIQQWLDIVDPQERKERMGSL